MKAERKREACNLGGGGGEGGRRKRKENTSPKHHHSRHSKWSKQTACVFAGQLLVSGVVFSTELCALAVFTANISGLQKGWGGGEGADKVWRWGGRG